MSLLADFSASVGTFSLEVDIAVEDGRTLALLGPNGAGKTSVLRCLAGFAPLDQGRILVGGSPWEDVSAGIHLPPHRRRMGLVFQGGLLFPHLTVAENIAFGWRAQRRPTTRLDEMLVEFDLSDLAARYPSQLSGGQVQVVSLARALAAEPAVLGLDEPLASLDVAARHDVRIRLSRYLGGFPGPSLLVTHDPLDAAFLADDIAVIENGRIIQQGALDELTRQPRSAWVAKLVGVNLFRGIGHDHAVRLPGGEISVAEPVSGEVFCVIRPQSVALHTVPPEGSPRNVWTGRVGGVVAMGDRVRVELNGPMPLVAEVTAAGLASLGKATELWASVKATEVEVYPA